MSPFDRLKIYLEFSFIDQQITKKQIEMKL